MNTENSETLASSAEPKNYVCKQVLEHIVKYLVKEPEAIKIEAEEKEDNKLILKLHVAPSDRGRVIGKYGKTANAMRVVVKAAALKDSVDASVEIVD